MCKNPFNTRSIRCIYGGSNANENAVCGNVLNHTRRALLPVLAYTKTALIVNRIYHMRTISAAPTEKEKRNGRWGWGRWWSNDKSCYLGIHSTHQKQTTKVVSCGRPWQIHNIHIRTTKGVNTLSRAEYSLATKGSAPLSLPSRHPLDDASSRSSTMHCLGAIVIPLSGVTRFVFPRQQRVWGNHQETLYTLGKLFITKKTAIN